MKRLKIDLNMRSKEGYSPSRYNGPTPRVGEPVIVYEPEDGVEADGQIAKVDSDAIIAYIAVDWDSIRDMSEQLAVTESGAVIYGSLQTSWEPDFRMTHTTGAVAMANVHSA
jgi:hypothetical protein